jgi:peptide/nickel transport system substrate-binding protein
MIIMHRFFAIFWMLLLITACKPKFNYGDKMIFRYNESSGIQTLDPAFASGQSTIWACNQLYNGLVDLDDQMQIVPAIAKSWEISDAGTLYTFHLRCDVQFHNISSFPFKTPRYVTAHDFVYSFRRITNPATASPGAWIFQQVKRDTLDNAEFTALNDSTLQITLDAPFPPFLGILTMKYCSVIPHEAVEKFGKDFRNNPIGTGPFQFQMWEEGVKLVFRKNSHYFETDSAGVPLPYLDAVAISFIADKQSAFMEFMKGTLDFMSGIDASYKDALLGKSGELQPAVRDKIIMLTGPYLNTEYLGFLLKDDKKDNPLLIKKIRQAINYGFDRKKMMQYLRNNAGIAGIAGFLPMGMPAFNPEVVHGYDYNPEKALQLLAESGFPNGVGLPPIALSVSAQYVDLCAYVQHELSKIGITVTLDMQQAAQQRQMMRNYQLSFFRGSWICDYPDAENYLSLFYSKNLQPFGSNYTHYTNPAFDRLFEQSYNLIDDSLRNRCYARLDSLLMADAPVVVLYYDKVVRFTQKNVHNLGVNPINMLNLKRAIVKRI